MTCPHTVTLPPLTLWVAINSSWVGVDINRVVSKGSFSRCTNSMNSSDTNDCVGPESNKTKAKWQKMGSVLVTTASGASACLVVIACATARPYCCLATRPLWFCVVGWLVFWSLFWGQFAVKCPVWLLKMIILDLFSRVEMTTISLGCSLLWEC